MFLRVFYVAPGPLANFLLQDLVNEAVRAKSKTTVAKQSVSSLLLRDFYDFNLSQFISEATSGCSERIISESRSAASSAANADVHASSPAFIQSISDCQAIFLSGVTGFLGCHLLQDLINTSSANIHCLVRVSSDSKEDARHKLNACLHRYRITLSDSQLQRVIVHVGNLTLPLFGLPEEEFLHLSACVDAVVHNGAHVNWLMTYSQLRAANVMVCRYWAFLA